MQGTIVSKFYIFSTPIEYEKMEKKTNMLINIAFSGCFSKNRLILVIFALKSIRILLANIWKQNLWQQD